LDPEEGRCHEDHTSAFEMKGPANHGRSHGLKRENKWVLEKAELNKARPLNSQKTISYPTLDTPYGNQHHV